MKHTRDSRKEDKTAAENTAAGGNDVKNLTGNGVQQQSAAPQSWKQYVEQAMPVKEQKAEAQSQTGKAAPEFKMAEGNGFGPKVLSAAGTAWNKVNRAAAACRERLDQGTAKIRGVVARHPVSPLLYATLLAMGIGVMAFNGTYARAYVMEVNGQEVGMVSNEDEANAILGNVETRAASILGDDFDYEVDVTLSPVFAPPDALSDAAEMEDTLFSEVGAYMDAYAISVDGEELGYAADKNEFYRMLDEIAQPYVPENAERYEFVEDVQVYPVILPSNTKFDVESIRAELSSLLVEEEVYTVKKGDTFNAIAYSLDMNPNELSVLNPDVIVNKLWVDQELIIQQAVPRLSVEVTASETYEEVVPSPVEYIETPDLYVGETKVKEQGEDGLDKLTARVTYVNNVEMNREILDTTTIKEATTTYTYTGTTPRPVTASNGYFIWPVRGRITSYFGGRNLWGSYDFHLGLDIGVPMGTSIKAADGGTVIKAGWHGSYGNLVAIRHDNGLVTYYGHNSSLLVSVGEKVYQGQIIARAGSTGNSSGPHCHFEVRVEGTSVNPLNYLK